MSLGMGLHVGMGGSGPYLPESLEFFTRASVTDPAAKEDIDVFVRQTKAWGIYDKLVYVPCLSTHGGLHQLGGAAQRTNTPWTAVNCTVVTEGVSITRNGVGTHLLSQQNTNNTVTPVAYGCLSYQAATPNRVLPLFDVARRVGRDGFRQWALGMEFSSAITYLNLRYIHEIFTGGTQGYGITANNYMNSHLFAASANGTVNYERACDNKFEAATHSNPIAYTDTKAMRFYPPVPNDGQTGVIQGAFFYYGRFDEVGYAVWNKFLALCSQTFLSRRTDYGYRRIILSGQSNASANLAARISTQADGLAMGAFSVNQSNIGGQPIANWVGNFGNNSRAANYNSTIWNSNPATPTSFQRSNLNVGRKTEYFIWFQGEGDLDAATNAVYQQQLAFLINYFREDSGNADMKVIVVQIDHWRTMRQANSNLIVSNFAGGLTGLNGTYTLTTLTTETDPYVWTKAGYRVEQQANKWVYVETTGNTVVASAVQSNLPHPAMATSWVDASNNPITPIYGTQSFLEANERVRYAQREICNDLSNVYTIDSRGSDRSVDGVHITDAGHIPFGAAIAAFILTL